MPIIATGSHSVQLAASLAEAAPRPIATRSERECVRSQSPPIPGVPASMFVADWHHCRTECSFSPGPITRPAVQALVDGALQLYGQMWPSSDPAQARLSVLIGASDVTGLSPGLYLADNDTLIGLAGFPAGAVNPGGIAGAAAILHLCGSLEAVCGSHGIAGYGMLLVRTGALAQATLRCAVGTGLAAAALSPTHTALTEAAARSGLGLTHLASVAIGRPVNGSVTAVEKSPWVTISEQPLL